MTAASRRLLLWAPVVLLLAVEAWLSSRPKVPVPRVPMADKVVHAGYFFGVGLFAVRAARGQGWSPSKRAVMLVGAGVLWGALDEWHQSFVPGRQPSVLDAAADAAGVALAVALFARRRIPVLEGRGEMAGGQGFEPR